MILLTGGTGYVGGNLVARAQATGLTMVATYRGSGDHAMVEAGVVEWAACDLTDLDAVKELSTRTGVTSCIHLAAVSNEAYARPDPLAAVRGNVEATATLLEAARDLNWRRFVLVSTGSVFQNRPIDGVPIPEDAEPAPQNVYSITKTAAEMLCRMFRTEYDVPAVVARISWVYGPPLLDIGPTRGPIPSFVVRALRGDVIDEGGADFEVSFTFVEDVLDGLLALDAADNLTHDAYHLGHGRNFALGEVADAIRTAIPDAQITLKPGTDPWTRFTALRDPLGIGRMQADTGFETKWSLPDGIASIVRWLEHNPDRWPAARP